jgi:hypothetical protein
MPIRKVTCKGKVIVIPNTVNKLSEALNVVTNELADESIELLPGPTDSDECLTQVKELFPESAAQKLNTNESDDPTKVTSPPDTARTDSTDSTSSTSSTASTALPSAIISMRNANQTHNYPYMMPTKNLKNPKGGKRKRKTVKKMSKRKLTKWCKSKKNRRSKKGRKMCKKLSHKRRN